MPLRTAVLQLPLNLTQIVRFVQLLCNFLMKREAGGHGDYSGEFSVGLAARRDVVSQPAT